MSGKPMRKVPIVATVVVIAAVITMIGLGFWQLGRLDEKEALIASYEAAADLPVTDLANVREADGLAFRTVRMACPEPSGPTAVAGRNRDGQTGYVHRFACQAAPGTGAVIYGEIGWSRGPDGPAWEGGDLEGVLVPLGDDFKLVSETAHAGLEASARPDPNDLPNNHLAYAFQWFFFALTALVIYGLALRRRWRDRAAQG
ncbi:SURF1 family protein [Aurantiacibacter gilvus]|uniref:SURF1-like protein n=1 Tax=Aurantiacibacter gilvus TaxID=3139141 RepID=A0ABU9IEI9_9SPHN